MTQSVCKLLFVSLSLVLQFVSFNPLAAQSVPTTRNVVYVTLDGMRWQEIFGGAQDSYVTKACGVRDVDDIRARYVRPTPEERRELLLPFFWNMLAKQGQIFGAPDKNARTKTTNKLKFSYPGYSEMFVGFADDDTIRSNDKFSNPHVNVLEFLNRQPQLANQVAAFATWDVIPFILNRDRSGLYIHAGTGPILDEPLTVHEKYLNEVISDSVVIWNGNGLDSFTMHAAREYIRKHRPRVLYLGLGETDEWGHGRRYDLYLDAAHKADRFLSRLWDELQETPQYKGNTSLVISTDHGRGDSIANWTDHGKDVIDAEYIWIAVLGPDTPAGRSSGESR